MRDATPGPNQGERREVMEGQSRWVRHHMICPEERGESELLLEWRLEGDGEVLNGVSCKNPLLKDLGGVDCQWSCLEKIIEEKRK